MAESLPPTRDGLDTPCLVLDLDVLDHNLRAMQARVGARGKGLRPHAKSHKLLRPSTGGWRYDRFGDECGRIAVPPGAPPLRVGDRVEMVVSHCDPTVNLFDRFILTRGERVEGTWPIDLRGCCH